MTQLMGHEDLARVISRRVFYDGTSAVSRGQGMCYDRDYDITANAAVADGRRDTRVTDPTAGTMHYFAGVAHSGRPAESTGQYLDIVEPGGCGFVKTDETAVTVLTDRLYMNTSGVFNKIITNGGLAMAIPLQTIAAAGVIFAYICPINWTQQAFGTAAGRGPSPAIWGTCPWEAIKANPELGKVLWDDFDLCLAGVAAGVALASSGNHYQTYIDTGGSIDVIADTPGNGTTHAKGVLELQTNTTDEDQIVLGTDVAWIAAGTTYPKPWWFEARIALGSIADTKSGVFVGLQKAANAVSNIPLKDDATLAIRNLIGFWRNETDGDAWATVHSLDSGAIVTLAAAAAVPDVNFHKLGMHFDGTTVYFYYDGVVLADSVLPAATNFPLDLLLGPCFGMNNSAAAAASNKIDWWRMASFF